jgi:hypothetical protein
MKVARQFTAWKVLKKRPVPAGRYDSGRLAVSLDAEQRNSPGQRSYRPYGTALLLERIPGSKLPGYLHQSLRDKCWYLC